MEGQKTLKVLMLEDNKDDAYLIERTLRKDGQTYIFQRAVEREEFLHAVLQFKPDVILSDHSLPQFNSIDALKICKKERASVPFILVTGSVSEEFAVTCLKLGADDYLLKSNLSRLPSAIHRALKQRKQEVHKREARHALRKQNDKLLKANKELDSFVYSLSHNLRGPLVSMKGLLNLAEREVRSEELRNLHSLIALGVSKLDSTLDELKVHSKEFQKLNFNQK